MEGMATAAWRPYARPIEGRRVERKGVLKEVAWRRVERTAIVGDRSRRDFSYCKCLKGSNWEKLTLAEPGEGVFTLCTLCDDMSGFGNLGLSAYLVDTNTISDINFVKHGIRILEATMVSEYVHSTDYAEHVNPVDLTNIILFSRNSMCGPDTVLKLTYLLTFPSLYIRTNAMRRPSLIHC